jgi:serine phosphatase RsbU (regulator of sigma subunit)
MCVTLSFPPQNISDILLIGAACGIIAIIFIYRYYNIKAHENLKRHNRFLTSITTKLRNMQRNVKADLKTARQIQLGLLPSQIPEVKGMRIDVVYQPVIEVGGDIYDFFRFDDNRLGIFIGDASGHGFAAALIGTLSKMSLYHHSRSAQFRRLTKPED